MDDQAKKEYIKWMWADTLQQINVSLGIYLALLIAFWVFVA
jgi:hypothetical protein